MMFGDGWCGLPYSYYEASDKTPRDKIAGPERRLLLDHFASAALTGLLAHPDREGTYRDICEQAYDLAQEMLSTRERN